MRLRPHHLLCTQGYSGRGYSDAFVENMSAITGLLRGQEECIIELVFSTDDICVQCPNMLTVDLCKDQAKVKRFDQKVVAYFSLLEQRYSYRALINEINSKMTPAMLEDICHECNWYAVSACKRNILG